MYIIYEIQTDANGNVAHLTPVHKATKEEAESEFYIKLGYAAISNVAVHTVTLENEEGFQAKRGCYKHPVQPTPEPEPEPEET